MLPFCQSGTQASMQPLYQTGMEDLISPFYQSLRRCLCGHYTSQVQGTLFSHYTSHVWRALYSHYTVRYGDVYRFFTSREWRPTYSHLEESMQSIQHSGLKAPKYGHHYITIITVSYGGGYISVIPVSYGGPYTANSGMEALESRKTSQVRRRLYRHKALEYRGFQFSIYQSGMDGLFRHYSSQE